MSDCIHALPHPWGEIARKLPSSRAREEHCFLPECKKQSSPGGVLGCEVQEEPLLPCKATILSLGHLPCTFAQGLICL